MKNIVCALLFISLAVEASAQNGLTGYATPFPLSPGAGSFRYRHDLKVDVNNNVWVAFRDNGVGKFDGNTWTVYHNSNSSFPDTTANGIAFDASNNVWCATSNGLTKFDGTNWATFNISNSPLPTNLIKSVAANGNEIWAGTISGVIKYDGASWTIYNTSNSDLLSDTVNAVGVGQQGEMWFGTNSGLSKFYQGVWTSYTQTNPVTLLPRVINIEIDGNNDVWLGVSLNTVCKLENGIITDFVSQIYSGTVLVFNSSANSLTRNPQGKITTVNSGGVSIINGSEVSMKLFGRSIGGAYVLGTDADYDSNGNLWIATRRASSTLIFPDSIFRFDIIQHNNYGLGFTNENYKFLDINNVKTLMLNDGMMHWDLSNSKYEVPKGSGKHSVFASALWIGGLDQNDSLHVAAQTYRQTGKDFWPGPIDTVTRVADSSQVIPYDRIWKVNRFDVEDFKYNYLNGNVGNGTYTILNDMLEWPAHGAGNLSRNLAPFVDYNSDGTYNPYDGDYPLIKGDQMLYWIFNDNLSQHTETSGLPLGFEIHASAYAYTCPNINDTNVVLNTTTLYQYRIINRSINDYDSLFIGLWCDNDLGNAIDDYVGCDTMLHAGFVYNGDNDDEGAVGYGLNPPMQNVQVLKGPEPVLNDGIDNDHDGTVDETGEMCMMNHFLYYNGGGNPATSNPDGPNDIYHYLQSIWLDGLHLTYGGDGRDPLNPPTDFMFSGTPYSGSGWTETSVGNPPDDRRFIMSSGPFSLASGAETTIDFAYVFTWDSLSPNGLNSSIARNIADLQRVKYWFDIDSFPSCLLLNVGVEEGETDGFEFAVFPNPAHDKLYVQLDEKNRHAENYFQVIDLAGRISLQGKLRKEFIDISSLENGFYFLNLNSEGKTAFRKFVKN